MTSKLQEEANAKAESLYQCKVAAINKQRHLRNALQVLVCCKAITDIRSDQSGISNILGSGWFLIEANVLERVLSCMLLLYCFLLRYCYEEGVNFNVFVRHVCTSDSTHAYDGSQLGFVPRWLFRPSDLACVLLQVLRRQYAGCVPLAQQEQFAQLLKQTKLAKLDAERKLKEVGKASQNCQGCYTLVEFLALLHS